MVDKVENSLLSDEPHMVWNYSGVWETMPGNLLELTSKVHDYLAHPWHNIFMQADIQHGYYSVVLHPEDHHIFAFTILGIGQLQLTRMP